jgi:plastocyanin
MPLAHTRGMIQFILAAVVAIAPHNPIVSIDQFTFKPAVVTIRAGESVRFVNRDEEAHTVSARDQSFDSGGLDMDGSWTHRFTKPGTYRYFCALHPYMQGTIVVVPAGGHTQ